MDIVNDLRSLVTVFFLILFLGIVAWAYSSRNRSAFDEAASLALDENERELLEHCIVQMENETGLDRNAALADMRYTFIETCHFGSFRRYTCTDYGIANSYVNNMIPPKWHASALLGARLLERVNQRFIPDITAPVENGVHGVKTACGTNQRVFPGLRNSLGTEAGSPLWLPVHPRSSKCGRCCRADPPYPR